MSSCACGRCSGFKAQPRALTIEGDLAANGMDDEWQVRANRMWDELVESEEADDAREAMCTFFGTHRIAIERAA